VGRTIGAVTIGQSPRDDIVPVIQQIIGADVEILQCGALDGMKKRDVADQAPASTEGVLVTRMSDGSSVRVRREFLVPRIKHCIHSLESDAELIMMLCTDPFSGLESRRLLLSPGRILLQLVASLEVHRIGVLTPDEAQRKSQYEKWVKVVREVYVGAVSPYTEADRVTTAAEALAREEIELLVMDCIGYTPEMKAAVRDATGCPVFLATTTLAHVAADLLGKLN
jgi:protein AroM